MRVRAQKHASQLVVPGKDTPPTYDQTLDMLDAFANWGPQSELLCLPEDTHAVCLTVPDESRLLELHHRLAEDGIPHKLICEPDPPHNGAAMAIGLLPCPRELVRRRLARFSLLR